MPTNKQRRDAARRHLERQLERRAEREAAHKRFALISSVLGGIAIIVLVVALVIVFGGSDNTKSPAASGKSASAKTSTSKAPAANATCPTGDKPVPHAKGSGEAVSFHGVTVKGAKNLRKPPSVGSSSTKPPGKLLIKDLVTGKGKAATPKSTVGVGYVGVLYCDGTEFDASAKHGSGPASFPLNRVIPGFTQGIGGTKSIPPMKVGGRRIIIMPPKLGYGPSPQQGSGIPPNAPLVFVVTLKKVS